jgi:hypothetical protein
MDKGNKEKKATKKSFEPDYLCFRIGISSLSRTYLVFTGSASTRTVMFFALIEPPIVGHAMKLSVLWKNKY